MEIIFDGKECEVGWIRKSLNQSYNKLLLPENAGEIFKIKPVQEFCFKTTQTSYSAHYLNWQISCENWKFKYPKVHYD